jgi:Asp-tRNA(Asn)/Glu-tRNA(Gln) amidotransferase A subunit family amidase
MASETPRQYFNWPDSLESHIPYKEPPKGANPAVRGIVLTIGAPLVENLRFFSRFLYKNAGFGNLSKIPELQEVKHRYDPTVIPIETEQEKKLEPFIATSPENPVRSSLVANGPPLFWSARDYHNAYKSGVLTPTEVITALLPLIRKDIKDRHPHSISFITVKPDTVLAEAAASTERYAAGQSLGLLDGVPVSVKDDTDVAGYVQTHGTKINDHTSEESSWCVKQWQNAGAIVVGKANMHEIGMDTTGNNFTHGTPLNPYNQRYYCGGSSTGSSYAVSTGLVPFALGTDGGGSVRIPSSYCGVFGLKTSHSRVSEKPTPDIAGTVAVIGPIAATMDSLEVAYRVMATPDPTKWQSAAYPIPRPLSAPRKKVLGIPRKWFNRADEPVRSACEKAVQWYATERGYQIVDIEIPLLDDGQTAHAMTIMQEGGNGVPDRSFLQPANRILLAVGSNCSADDFLSAQRVRQIIMRHLGFLFDTHGHDMIIVTPTTPNAGWHYKPADLKNGVSDGDMTIRNMMYIWMANFCGTPALTFPAGFVKPAVGTGDIPVGLMGMGVWGGEEGLIEWGFEGEKYLHEVLEGGRLKSPIWSDVISLAKEAKSNGVVPVSGDSATPAVNEVTNGAQNGTTATPAPKDSKDSSEGLDGKSANGSETSAKVGGII